MSMLYLFLAKCYLYIYRYIYLFGCFVYISMYALNRYLVICLTTILCVSLTNLLFLPDYWEVRVDLSGAK